ncbi:MAG: membrane protein insertion efficiency factor YidD [Ignavibacteriales bacterium]|nr:MAG: membrane protein insertion efficiency factor YidD [Ignavibacteriales bacterium]
MRIFLINISLLFSIQITLFAQTDRGKWEKVEKNYRIENESNRVYNFKSETPGDFLLNSIYNTYHFFISDVDGDNCPFRPSCSAFFVEAVKETNFFQGSLMFFDRFTRDLNIFRKGKYPVAESGNYYDPANLYTLSEGINFNPPAQIIIAE